LVGHYTRLTHRQFSVDLGAYPLGSCTMKYNPKFCDAVAADAGPGHMLAAGGAPLVTLFRERRKALKFRPAAPRVEALIAQDYGDKDINLIPADAVDTALDRLLNGSSAVL